MAIDENSHSLHYGRNGNVLPPVNGALGFAFWTSQGTYVFLIRLHVKLEELDATAFHRSFLARVVFESETCSFM